MEIEIDVLQTSKLKQNISRCDRGGIHPKFRRIRGLFKFRNDDRLLLFQAQNMQLESHK